MNSAAGNRVEPLPILVGRLSVPRKRDEPKPNRKGGDEKR